MRRRTPTFIGLLLALALVAGLAVGGCSEARTTSATTQPQSTATVEAPSTPATGDPGSPEDAQTEPPDTPDFEVVPATVTRVVDGDTAVVTLGGDGRSERVRFIGVNTPESTTQHQPYGEEASAYTKKRLSGRRVWLQVGTEQRDRYQRLLAYVWLEPPANTSDAELRTKQFNAQLLLEGYAQLMTIPPNVDYVDSYRVFQTEAREANRGLWALPISEAEQPAPTSGAGTGGTGAAGYVGNRNSKKLHYPTCKYVAQMNPENKVAFVTRAAAISAGYAPCKVCAP